MSPFSHALAPCLFISLALLSVAPLSVHAQTQPSGMPPITAVSGTGTLGQPADPDHFSFVAFGDSQGQEDHPTLKAIFTDMNKAKPKPSFAISLGDIIRGEPIEPFNPDVVAQPLMIAVKLAKRAGVPVFNAPGNHEMDDVTNTNPWTEMPSLVMRQKYEEIVAPARGAFDYGNSRFLIVNTEDLPPQGMTPPPEGEEFSYVGLAQRAEIDADLAANTGKTHIFIAMHYPIHAKNANRDNLHEESRQALIAIFKKYTNISFVLCSHEHLFYNAQDPNNGKTIAPFKAGDATQYLVSGGAGAPMYSPLPWGFHHYLRFEINGPSVTATICPVR